MEDTMDTKIGNHSSKLDLPTRLEFENGADATGLWFAAAAVFALIAAGVILFRDANPEFQTASNDSVLTVGQPAHPSVAPR
jgi:hypothetical protein